MSRAPLQMAAVLEWALGQRSQQHFSAQKSPAVRSAAGDKSSLSFCRRRISIAICIATLAPRIEVAFARGRNKKVIPIEDYKTAADGLKYYDVLEGNGPVAVKGETVVVHFDCLYRGIDAVSSREAKLLGGNRIIAQPYELIVGSVPGRERKREFVDNANGLFSAQASPKPPPALYTVVEGMRVGGKRTVIVTPDVGYGDRGMNEIPPKATFDMSVELLELKK
ncbi:peptidyl-prolyl cis-trans isomerase FKBP18, chloroplastic [Selaginella moellendorffii]|uniref:peptidyl-prolyl cis-trans isomerase FKBP18, chloroplastic n=1 Tax=Selaginella moellendorffii TaxID=88036 RepID=UPI000D1CE0AC|nr:peptidyl-prolyl cis-trans isomerase FKBP18, chloroplastic [Selaginella moellendorffii]|eukprot:XP_024538891.1 peptidyl-prolyl cis-trans isomerase FKBP18, chloroplastic [Selaginella moellendorffii]